MALPVTLLGMAFPVNSGNGRLGPFKSSGGNFYAVFIDLSFPDDIEIMKATDPTVSFSNIATHDIGTLSIVSMAVHQEGDDLHIVLLSTGTFVMYGVFSMSSDTFTTTPANVNDGTDDAISDDGDADQTCDISVRSDGDVIIVYSGDEDNDMGNKDRVDYARLESGTWTVDIAVDDAGATHYTGPGMVRGASDLMHIFYAESLIFDIHHKSLNSSNTLSTVDTFVMNLGTTREVCRPVYYDDGGVERITVLQPGPGSEVQSVIVEDDGTPDTVETASDGTNDVDLLNATITFTLAVDGKTVHALWSGGGSNGVDQDLYHDKNTDDGGWGTDVELLDAVTINAISANVYTRNGYTVLAVVYDNGGTITYNEFPLAFTPTKLSDTKFTTVQGYHGPFEI